jgi:tRNA dimethylallyltransferase
MAQRRVVLIAGPTASGKSALAISRAQAGGGAIINADSMQVYDTLRVVTARPSIEDEALAEHHLYGVVPVAKRFSTGEYIRKVDALIQEIDPARELIFVGGTGLYFDALTKGFADIPEVPHSVMLSVEDEIADYDEAQRMALLVAEDPVTASRLKVADPQRVVRALSVKRATGRALSSYQDDPQAGILADAQIERFVMWPERDVLRERIAHRFDHMFDNGAVEEVQAVLAQNLDPMLPVMKAIGVPEIAAWLRGEMDEDEAIRLATTATHQYAKRQRTWFRNRMSDWPRLGLGGTPL